MPDVLDAGTAARDRQEGATADAPLFGLGERRPAVKHFVAENCSGGCLSLAELTGDPEVGSKPANI